LLTAWERGTREFPLREGKKDFLFLEGETNAALREGEMGSDDWNREEKGDTSSNG